MEKDTSDCAKKGLIDTFTWRFAINPMAISFHDPNAREDETLYNLLLDYHLSKGIMYSTDEVYERVTEHAKFDFPEGGEPTKLEFVMRYSGYQANYELCEETDDGDTIPLYWFEMYPDRNLDYLNDFKDRLFFSELFVFRLRSRRFEDIPMFLDVILKIHFDRDYGLFRIYLKGVIKDFFLTGTALEELVKDWMELQQPESKKKKLDPRLAEEALFFHYKERSNEIMVKGPRMKFFADLEMNLNFSKQRLYNQVNLYQRNDKKRKSDLRLVYVALLLRLGSSSKSYQLMLADLNHGN